MILDTFTYEQLFSTMKSAYKEMSRRAESYMSHNLKKLNELSKNGDYAKTFYGEINHQRYSLGTLFRASKKGVHLGTRGLHTVVMNHNRKLVVEIMPQEKFAPYPTFFLTIYTEHFLNRYCERLKLCEADLPLLDKAILFYDNTDVKKGWSDDENIINKSKEPSLEAAFLPKVNKRKECACFKNGDLAVVEIYDNVYVWRTYITKEMLFDDQLENDTYIEAVEKSVKLQDTEEELDWVPKKKPSYLDWW